ncbi:hypothetical protein MMC06_006106 [Schaereria dolodes]|nr:hypothetical protein [Schaereria dolodes]
MCRIKRFFQIFPDGHRELTERLEPCDWGTPNTPCNATEIDVTRDVYMPFQEHQDAPEWTPNGIQVVERRHPGPLPGNNGKQRTKRIPNDLKLVFDFHIPFTKRSPKRVRTRQVTQRHGRPQPLNAVAQAALPTREPPPAIVDQPFPPPNLPPRPPVAPPPGRIIYTEPRPPEQPPPRPDIIAIHESSDEEPPTPIRHGRVHQRRRVEAASPTGREDPARRNARLEDRLRELREELSREQAASRRESLLRRLAEINEARARHQTDRALERETERGLQEAERRMFENTRRQRLERDHRRPVDVDPQRRDSGEDRGTQILREAAWRGRQAGERAADTQLPFRGAAGEHNRRRGMERRTWDDDEWRDQRRRH